MPVREVISILKNRLGEQVFEAFNPFHSVPSPMENHDTSWVKNARTVGINVRTIGSFWNVIPYSLTLPAAQNALHLLPIWEPGVVASLYGMSSWNLNAEFFSYPLAVELPHLDTVEKQLKVVINILHLLDRSVGMDVVPHTDRFSEQVCANPQHFEWLIRRDMEIVDHSNDLHHYAQKVVFEFLKKQGSANMSLSFPETPEAFFSSQLPENQRLEILFGKPYDYEKRVARRKILVQRFYELGFETAPATMGPPYRGLEVDPNDAAKTVDEDGLVWRDFRIKNPQKFSRAFGPLTRFKLYESLDDNRDWQLDFSKPRPETWKYVCEKYAAVQREFGFDFMRGDMSHVQMRPEGVPKNAAQDPFYDLLGAVKQYVLKEKSWFGYFAESFLAPPNEMAYGDECDHLEASFADSTLGDLQNESVGSPAFMKMFSDYAAWHETRRFAPNFTILTADKDDPRFDSHYLTGNEIRYFISIFLTDWPSYMALGFECRDPHPTPAPNEHYTKLYVFQEKKGPKVTYGPYVWGENRRLYTNLTRIKLLADQIFTSIKEAPTRWIFRPDGSAQSKIVAWTQRDEPRFLFVANLDCENSSPKMDLPFEKESLKILFSTVSEINDSMNAQPFFLEKGEGRVFKIG